MPVDPGRASEYPRPRRPRRSAWPNPQPGRTRSSDQTLSHGSSSPPRTWANGSSPPLGHQMIMMTSPYTFQGIPVAGEPAGHRHRCSTRLGCRLPTSGTRPPLASDSRGRVGRSSPRSKALGACASNGPVGSLRESVTPGDEMTGRKNLLNVPAESEREINGIGPGRDARVLPGSECRAIWRGGSGYVRIGP